jgi:hypothetical protein
MRILTAIFFLTIFVLPPTPAHAAEPCGVPGAIQMQVYIPFISATIDVDGKPCHYLKSFTEPGDNTKDVGTLPDYIKGLFTFSISIAGLVAMVMIMVGGLQWTMAGGHTDRVKAAQTRISNAIIGLLLLLFSYTILATINPKLVKLGALNVPDVQGLSDLSDADIYDLY